jgi:hypothetical protein
MHQVVLVVELVEVKLVFFPHCLADIDPLKFTYSVAAGLATSASHFILAKRKLP